MCYTTLMHIFFSGIGGAALGPLAMMARQAGHEVSGSDKQDSLYLDNLRGYGIEPYVGQTHEAIAALHARKPIDWLVYSSAIPKENPEHPELVFAENAGIRHSKRDELLNQIITDNNLKLLAVAGTHGKTTTTALMIWLFKQLGITISYSVGAKIPFGAMGHFDPVSEYFVYECDEFDYNFLSFSPHRAIISGIGWDHHEIFPTREAYNQAFQKFIGQSKRTLLWDRDLKALEMQPNGRIDIEPINNPAIDKINLRGRFNREDAWLVMKAVHEIAGVPLDQLQGHIEHFPGLKQRMELLVPNLYTNYAHTPEKIRGGMSVAQEITAETGQKIVVIYEPLTNRRQHHIKEEYQDSFAAAAKIYWIPTYMAREDRKLPVLSPKDLIPFLSNAEIAEPAELNNTLLEKIKQHLADGDLVVAIGASGGGSLDEWLRARFKPEH
jgi:UDP-N-acetylmuramate--alanine ligase